MANIWENAVITNKGVELQAKILAGGEITITSVKVGAGSVPVNQLNEQLAVSNIKQTATINNMMRDGNMVTIPVQVTNEGVTTAYDLRQVGFYVTDPDEGEILYAIAQNTQARHIPTEAESPGYKLYWKFHFSISNDVNLTANLSEVTRAEDVYFNNAFGYLPEFTNEVQKAINYLASPSYVEIGFLGGFEASVKKVGHFKMLMLNGMGTLPRQIEASFPEEFKHEMIGSIDGYFETGVSVGSQYVKIVITDTRITMYTSSMLDVSGYTFAIPYI